METSEYGIKLTMVKSRESRYLNKTSGDILRAILSLVGPDGTASMSDIARRNNTSRAFVTKMLKSLSDEGMVDYVAYRGVGLTPDGLRVANELARHHRLLEVFLIDTLGFASEAAHEEAERLEHVISEEFEERLAAFLNHPTHCPHGQPIPGSESVGSARNVRSGAAY